MNFKTASNCYGTNDMTPFSFGSNPGHVTIGMLSDRERPLEMENIISFGIFLMLTLPIAGRACAIDQKISLHNGVELRTDDQCHLVLREKIGKSERVDHAPKGVEGFLVSPTEQYIAYEKFVDVDEEDGIFKEGETRETIPVCDIEVVDLRTRKVLGAFSVSQAQDRYLHLEEWASPHELIFVGGSQFDIASYYHFDSDTGRFRIINYEEYSKLRRTRPMRKVAVE